MKQYTTPTVTLNVPDMADLLAAADRVVVVAKSTSGTEIKWQDDELTIDGENISFTMTPEQTASLDTKTKVEATIFVGDKIYKTETVTMRITAAVWDNGE